MAEPTIQLGGGNWAGKTDNLLGYYKEGERFYKQDFTFSRSTTGTYTDSEGYIQEMPYNKLTYSNDFSNAAWGTSSATISSGESGYDGTNNAWSLNSSSEGYLFQYLTNETSNTLSIYAKAGSVNNIRLRFFGTSNGEGYFNLSNGTKGTTSGLADSSIENVGNGWYRCNISINTTISLVRIYPSVSSSSSSGTNGFVYIQNAQVNSGTSAKTYFPTTTRLNMPRVDYLNNSNGSLILEPQRSNLVTYSESFDNAYWSNTRVTITANTTLTLDPSGENSSELITQSASDTNGGAFYRFFSFSAASYTYSIFVKMKDVSFISIAETTSASGTVRRSWFNIQNGTLGTINSAHTAKIESYQNGWYRCSITFTATSGSYSILNYLSDADNSTTAVVNKGLYVYGAQLEQGSYATSYIPTSGSSVTRNADVAGDSNFTPSSNKATLFIEIKGDDNTKNRNVCGFRNGTTNQYGLYFWGSDNNKFGFNSWSNDSYGITNSTIFDGNTHKIAAVFDFSDFTQNVLYIDGVKQTISQTRGTTSQRSQNKVSLSAPSPDEKPIQEVINFKCFNTALTDAELAALTTL